MASWRLKDDLLLVLLLPVLQKGCELSNEQLCVRRRHTAAFASPFHVVARCVHILSNVSNNENRELVLLSLLPRMSKQVQQQD
jgi:hypothetical protein